MLAFYTAWLALPALVGGLARNALGWRALRWALVLLVATIAVTQDSNKNKDREVYKFLIDAIAYDNELAMEPGFYLFVRALAVFFSDSALHTVFFFVVAAASFYIKLSLFRRYGGSIFGCLSAYFSYYFLVQEATQVRIGLAVGVLYFSWFAFAQGRKLEFWLYGFVATMFHASCMIFLIAPVVFSRSTRSHFSLRVLVLALLATTSILAGPVLLAAFDSASRVLGVEIIATYLLLLEEGVLSSISPLRIFPHFVLILFMATLHRRWSDDRTTSFLVELYLYGIGIFIILWPVPAFAYRISDLFLFSGILLIGRLKKYIRADLYYPVVLSYTVVFLVYTIEYSGLFLSSDSIQ